MSLASGLIAGGEDNPVRTLEAFYRKTDGVRHKLGSCTRSEMDCSCYVQKLFTEKFDLDLPRTTLTQVRSMPYLRVRKIQRRSQLTSSNLCAGDLIYTYVGNSWESGTRHVVVYAGHSRVLHSSSSFKGVQMSSLDWVRDFHLEGVFRPLGC